LKPIKQTLKSPVKPLQQLARRDKETTGKLLNPKDPYDPDLITLRFRRSRPLPEQHRGDQFHSVATKHFTLSTSDGNKCFTSSEGETVFLSNIIRNHRGEILLAGQNFSRKCDFYDFPMRSSTLNIFTVTLLQDRTSYWNLNDVTSKNIAIPLGESYVCFPLIHFNK